MHCAPTGRSRPKGIFTRSIASTPINDFKRNPKKNREIAYMVKGLIHQYGDLDKLVIYVFRQFLNKYPYFISYFAIAIQLPVLTFTLCGKILGHFRRIIKTNMKNFAARRKIRTGFMGMSANGDDCIQVSIPEFIYQF